MIRRALALLACACITACGGGGSDSGPEPVARAPLTLAVYGDSINNLLYPLLAERYGAGRVTNHAKGGSTSTDLLRGTDGINSPWPSNVVADVVMLDFGANDAYSAKRIGLEQYRANLLRLANAPARVVLQTPLPSAVPGRDLAPYAEVMRQVAREKGLDLVDMFACLSAVPGWQSLLYDQTHPSPEGLQVLMACIAPVLDAVMGGQR